MRAEVSKKMEFAAAHRLPNYDGKCSQLHGHTWEVEITISGEIGDKTGMVVDFSEMKKILAPIIEEHFDHHQLNDIIENPTAEHIAEYLYNLLLCEVISGTGVRLEAVTVWESSDSKATVRG